MSTIPDSAVPDKALAEEPALVAPAAPAKRTERTMLDLLTDRYTVADPGRPPRFLHAEHVRNDANRAKRTADFMVCDTHAGGQAARIAGSDYPIHGFEVKVSRADWLKELADPDKAKAFTPYVHYWWLVVAAGSIVKEGELPDGWGLLVASGDTLRCKKAAALNPDVVPMPAGMRVALMRSLLRTAQVQPAPWKPRPRRSRRRTSTRRR